MRIALNFAHAKKKRNLFKHENKKIRNDYAKKQVEDRQSYSHSVFQVSKSGEKSIKKFKDNRTNLVYVGQQFQIWLWKREN